MIFCIFQWLGLKTGNVSTSIEWYSPSSDPPPLPHPPPKKTGATVNTLSNTVHVLAVHQIGLELPTVGQRHRLSFYIYASCLDSGMQERARESMGSRVLYLESFFLLLFLNFPPSFLLFSLQDNLGPLYLPHSILSLGFICLYSADKFTCLQVLQVVCEFQSV